MKREKRKMKKIFTIRTNLILLIFSFLFFLSAFAYAQDFGFGFDDPGTEAQSSALSVSASGKISLQFPFYFNDYVFKWEELANAKINFGFSLGSFEAITSFNLSWDSISEFWDKDADWGKANHTPLFIDEAFLRVFLGPVNIEAGLRKLTWGRADSSGPLDVTNPIDFTDLRNITDFMQQKIARPLLRVTWNTGNFSKLEGVFIPNFASHRFAYDGRWAPSQYTEVFGLVADEIYNDTRALLTNPIHLSLFTRESFNSLSAEFLGNFSPEFPDTSSFDYFQTGIRFTTTIGSADIGAQYYYGNLFRPNFTVNGIKEFAKDLKDGVFSGLIPNLAYEPNTGLIIPQIYYTRYHQFGIDYAQVLYGFNIRAEFAFNLTEDYDGSDPALQNPFIAWSLGFDRDLFLGINLNVQCNETIRLFNSKIGDNPVYDCEAGTNVTNTRLTARISKAFLRDNLQTNVTVIWDIENSDCYIIPSASYTYKDFSFNLTAGFFAGDKNGELGQYYNNNFIRIGAAWIF